jgi:hypothetical protein
MNEVPRGGKGVEGLGLPERPEVEHDPQVAHAHDLRIAADDAMFQVRRPGIHDDRTITVAPPCSQILGDCHTDGLIASRRAGVVVHDKGRPERSRGVAKDEALEERAGLKRTGVRIVRSQDRGRQPLPPVVDVGSSVEAMPMDSGGVS